MKTKTIKVYISDDGVEFRAKESCEKYEALSKEVAEVMLKISPKPDDPTCKFANGGGYVQHKIEDVIAVRQGLLNIALKYINHRWINDTIKDVSVHPSYVGRILSESEGVLPLDRAWYRMMCVDFRTGKEWGQPFYANNPSQGKQKIFTDSED